MYNSSFSTLNSMKNSFLLEMTSRGLLNQCTDLNRLEELTNKTSIAAYIGFDCTAQSLHVGSLLQIMVLRLMQKHGHKPIVLFRVSELKLNDLLQKFHSKIPFFQ